MTETAYIFGTYFNKNSNLDPSRTKSRNSAKWRSIIPVRLDLGLQVRQTSGSWIFLQNVTEGGENNFAVEIVDISDLDYQLRSTDPVEDKYRIYCTEGAIRVERDKLIGDNAQIVATYLPPSTDNGSSNPNQNPFAPAQAIPKPIILPAIPFAEERLELGYDYGAVGGPTFATSVVKVADERETRNSDRVMPLHRFQLGDRLLIDEKLDKLEEVSYLRSFHKLRQGSYQGFRYKDWADYRVEHELIGIGDARATHWQLRKGYWIENVVTWRPITKPVVGTVVLYTNGEYTEAAAEPGGSGWTVNHETGVVSNPEPLAVGVVLTASFEFDVPVRFESDTIGFSLQAIDPDISASIYRLESVFVREIRLPMNLPWQIQPAGQITKELDLGIVYDTVEQYSLATERSELRSGWEYSRPLQDETKLVFNLGGKNYDREEVSMLLAYFWNARGKATEFTFVNQDKNYQVKFEQDQLNLKFLADQKTDSLFELAGLKLQLKKQLIFRPPPFSLELEPIFIDPQDPDNPSLASSGSSFYNGSQGAETQKEATAFNISTYQAQGVSFNVLVPPGETGTNVSYYVANLFWAAGTLHLLVTTNNPQSAYRDRLIHYRLNLTNGWLFEYQAQSSLALRVFIVSNTDINRAVVFKTNTGVSQFFRANNAVAFGDTANYTNKSNGSLRFEIKNSGGFLISFIDNQQLGVVYSVVPYMVHGDRAWFRDRTPYNERGTFDSITYFSNTGLPIRSNDLDNREYLYNFWTNYQTEPDLSEIIYHGDEAIFKYFANPVQNAAFYLNSGGDGSYLIKVLARYVCETGSSGCSTDERNDLIYFFLKSSYSAEPVLIDTQHWLTPSNPGDSNYIQIYNSQKTSCDRFGNQLVYAGNRLMFYRGGSGYGINITSTLGFSVVSIRNKPAVTPYGFAIMEHSGNLFGASTTVNLAFVYAQ